ncbi:hypothetical protein ACFLWH_01690 [Chloroflexota bacterium]
MITLDELLKETGINRNTLAKYRDLGLIPKPDIIHRGNNKQGLPRGNEALYPDYTPWLIEEITRLKSKPYRYSLSQIKEEIGQIVDITPDEDISEPLKSDDDIADAVRNLGSRLNQLTPRYGELIVSYDRNEKDGTLKVASVWAVQQKQVANKRGGTIDGQSSGKGYQEDISHTRE